jgi:hypothetical protein
MAEPQIINTLNAKRVEIETYIRATERRLAQARADLAHVNASIRIFQTKRDETTQFPVYMKLGKMFRRNELPTLIRDALQSAPEHALDTRELALAIMAAKGWDATDKALAVSVGARVVQTLSERKRRSGDILSAGKRAGVNVWRLALAT